VARPLHSPLRFSRPLRFRPAIVAGVACAVFLSACGGGSGVPANDAAVVNGSPITKATLNHWMAIDVASTSGPAATEREAVPVPPDFTACIAYERANAPKPAKGQSAPTAAALKAACQQTYTSALNEVMFFLITADWIEGETAADGITASPATIKSQLLQSEQSAVAQGAYPSVAALLRFLAAVGETTQDQLLRGRIAVLSNDLATKSLGPAPKITASQIAAYYKANPALLTKPETRDLRVVLVKKLASAKRVVALLRAGVPFSKVVRQFSIDPQTRWKGGVLDGQTLTGSSLPSNLATAVFKAPLNALEGPVRTTLGYEVFRVQKITPATKETLEQATPSISSTLAGTAQRKASVAFIRRFDDKWLNLTKCSTADAVATSPTVCRNAPPATTAATG
jgi:foldase protein PrsA